MKNLIYPLIIGWSLTFPLSAKALVPNNYLGSVKNENGLILSTGSRDRAASSLGKWLVGDTKYLSNYGTEGSGVKWSGLELGTYQLTWEMNSRDSQNDAFYFWNQKELGLLGDRSIASECVILSSGKCSKSQHTSGLVTSTFDVMYGDLALLALDTVDKRGTSNIKIHDLQKTSDLTYKAPVVMDLNTDNYLGDVRFKDNYTSITTGGKDRAISSLSKWLELPIDNLGTEGSGAIWGDLEAGEYEITWQVYTGENDFNNDVFYWWNGSEVQELTTRAIATNQRSKTRWDSIQNTTKLTIDNGKLGFLALDTDDKSGTSELRISRIEKVKDISFLKNSKQTSEPKSILGLLISATLLISSKKFL